MSRVPSLKRKAIFAAIVCHGFWGISFMASSAALSRVPVFLLLSHRFLLAFVIMTIICFTPIGDCHLRGKPMLPLILLGLFQPVIYFIGEQYGILHSSTIFSGVMIALIPIAASLAAIPILREKLSLRQFLCSMLSVGGVIGVGLLTNNSGSLDWIGIIGLTAAVLAASAYQLASRRISGSYTSFERSYLMICVGAVCFGIPAMITVHWDVYAYFRPFKEPGYFLPVIFLGVCCSVICFFLSNYVLTRLSVTQSAVFANLTTAVSVLAGILILHEPFSFKGLIYCVMILLGIYGVLNTDDSGIHEKKWPWRK